ncbi:MAG: transposase [Deltaproteobacteria bacterium RIFCSPLOWO2_01_FULL_45_74]|nr:MAG: transposase [Deltaproteobacteria bacterium RIFCSPHIGHO2_01_FULL_43_49]OGQ15354.1 MAG: transposase [Deltaproteobacteria bacterium RIFCSPHIGHO2_02_FULL_44_53]OGQ31464.1 MAG: transposase [Deltaproteobacteria bacterium RIFCSPLOWO2_01_FULL_45_74]OGQ42708.1 MAG: transposase [Deltaproteobacteria bacterium RIFCSPLOWO2_02_FULL_44_34]
MGRLARIVIDGCPHHVIQRGNRRQNVFFNDDDKEEYLRLIAKHTKIENLEIWAYCLMDNHVHLIVVPNGQESLARGVGETHRRYTRYVNFREGWRGYLWQGRFQSYPMDERHLFMAIRYIERNPVRAGIVRRAEDYRWSSAKAHVYSLEDPLLTHRANLLQMVGDWASYLSNGDSDEEKGLFRKSARTGRPLGNDEFIEKLERITGRTLRKQKSGPKLRN